MLHIKTDKPSSVSVKVLGDIPVEQSIEDFETNISIPVLGLYPNSLNKVEVTLDFEGGQQIDIIEIQTQEIPDFFPEIKVDKLN